MTSLEAKLSRGARLSIARNCCHSRTRAHQRFASSSARSNSLSNWPERSREGAAGSGHPAHEEYMSLAVQQARLALDAGEVPVGAVMVSHDGSIVAAAHNAVESGNDATQHAEMVAIREASRVLRRWRLFDCTLYVTLEPCPMCGSAAQLARLAGVVYGARNPLLGADGSYVSLLREGKEDVRNALDDSASKCHPFHPNMHVLGGVCEEECSSLMKQFFRDRRRAGSSRCVEAERVSKAVDSHSAAVRLVSVGTDSAAAGWS